MTAPGEITLTVNGQPVPVAQDGSFRIRQRVDVGRSKLILAVEGSHGDKAEHRVLVRRTTAVVTESIEYGTYYALIIGNNDYQTLGDLKMASSDAEAMAELLRERYGFQVELLIDATRADIISALARKRAQLTENDNLLIYYAGHGILDIDSGEGYWLPVDAERSNPVNWIALTSITAQLRAMSAKHVMVIADSCYSGVLTRGTEADLKTGAERTAWLTRMNARRSRTALTSGGLEPVLDAGGGKYSVFANAVLETLRTNTGVLDGQSLFNAIKRPVVVNADQTPEYADVRKAGHDGGDFLFVPLKVDVTVTVVTPQATPTGEAVTAQQEMLFWQSIQSGTDPAMFEAYLAQYPSGSFAVLARLKLEQLEEIQTAVAIPPPVPMPETSVQPVVGIYAQTYKPGETFSDCDKCPEMVVVPAGSFTMGSPSYEKDRQENEGPQHEVIIPQPFAVGIYEVTRREFARFISETGYYAGNSCYTYEGGEWHERSNRSWRDPSFRQTDRDPVVCMSWKDSQAYASWLSRETGKSYRLLSEAEWEYAARAGTQTRYWYGDDNTASQFCAYGNGAGRETDFSW